MKHLIIIGVGGAGRELYWTALQSVDYGKSWDVKGFLDGDVKLAAEEYDKLPAPLLGDIKTYEIGPDDVFSCGIGDSRVREKICTYMEGRQAKFVSVIHKTAIIQGGCKLGRGLIINPFAFVGDHAEIGDFVLVNDRSSCAHDCRVGNFVSIMGSVEITGYATVGDYTYMGSGSRVLPHGRVGKSVLVGAGAVVLRKVKDGKTVYGNPAREL